MFKRFNIAQLKDPRVLMRAIIGVMLAANLVVAVLAFHPFGGSAEDLRRERISLSMQLAQAQARLAASKHLVEKVQTARTQGDKFMDQYFMSVDIASAAILDELYKTAQEAGLQMAISGSINRESIEGSDTLIKLSAQVGFEGTYANLTKFVNLLDKSPRFLVIESMNAAAPQAQGGQSLNVTLKIDALMRDDSAAPAAPAAAKPVAAASAAAPAQGGAL
jgi:Tfp pilus assembly protein PilO